MTSVAFRRRGARQCWKQRGMRASLVDEIETPAGEGLHESARFDSRAAGTEGFSLKPERVTCYMKRYRVT